MGARARANVEGWLLVLPAAVLLFAFTHVPAIATFIDSLYSTKKGNRPQRFVGIDQYRTMVEDPVFWQAAWNNLIYAVGTVPTSIALALAMALWVNGRLRGRGFMRLAFFTPTVLPMIAAANIWLFFYTPDYGLLDQISHLFGGGSTNWLGSKDTVLWCLIVVTVWKEAGFFMIFFLAALQQIPADLGEAAALEGASRRQILWRITLPLLAPTMLFVAVNALINAFRLVDHIIAMTKGGPDNASAILLFYIYQVAFSFWDTSYAAALSVVLLVVLAAMAFAQFALSEKRVHYQ